MLASIFGEEMSSITDAARLLRAKPGKISDAVEILRAGYGDGWWRAFTVVIDHLYGERHQTWAKVKQPHAVPKLKSDNRTGYSTRQKWRWASGEDAIT